MSKVYSFRLEADNPREAQAMEVIDAWVSQGYSLRHILTNALIGYGGYGVSENKWDQLYNQLVEIVQGLETGLVEKDSVIDNLPLSRNFVAVMKEGAREGVRN